MPVEQAPEIIWHALSPMLILLAGGMLLLLVGVFAPALPRRFLAIGSFLTVVLSGIFLAAQLPSQPRITMNDMVIIDGVGLFASMVILAAAAFVIPVTHSYLREHGWNRVEYQPLLLFATLGMVMLATANDLIMVFIAIEVLSLALYTMVGIAKRERTAQEASLKYFLLGAFSSAILLYGVALLFGGTGSTRIPAIADTIAAGGADGRLVFAGLALLITGFAFKIGAVPFHAWTPDVYQGAPTAVTAFMAAGTKAAAFAALLRTLLVSFGAIAWDWRPVLWAIAIASMVLGSVVAIVQTDIKRMLGYSSVAHAGFILIGVVAADRDGLASSLFYLAVYALMTIGAFVSVMASGRGDDERSDLASWAGLGHAEPLFAGVMTFFLLSLAGIPPTGGFAAKFLVFAAAEGQGETGLVIVGVLSSVVAAFFYLRVIVLMWLQDPLDMQRSALDRVSAWTLGAAAGLVAIIGIYPQALIDLARNAATLAG
ncbi:MAG: NADH-quinone oxidoreductase subunit NuoN [Actinomycetota bacterium]